LFINIKEQTNGQLLINHFVHAPISLLLISGCWCSGN